MLISLLVTFLWIKRAETLRLLPMLIPLAIVIQIAMPGTLGTLKAIIKPSYVIQEQSRDMGTGSGRIADLGPSLREWSRTPFLGQGFGTRVVATDLGPGGIGEAGGAQILDDQWLGTLLEIGAVGALALLWLFVRAVRRLAARARSDPGPDGWLMTALAASLIVLRRGDAHLRRVRVHPGHLPGVHHVRLHGRGDPRRGAGRLTAVKRIGVAFPGDPSRRATWSGTPSGVMRGLAAAGAEPVAIRAEPRPLVRALGVNLIAAGYLRPRRDVKVAVRQEPRGGARVPGPGGAQLACRAAARPPGRAARRDRPDRDRLHAPGRRARSRPSRT